MYNFYFDDNFSKIWNFFIDFQVLRERESLWITDAGEAEFKIEGQHRSDLIGETRSGLARQWQDGDDRGFIYQDEKEIFAIKVSESRKLEKTYSKQVPAD